MFLLTLLGYLLVFVGSMSIVMGVIHFVDTVKDKRSALALGIAASVLAIFGGSVLIIAAGRLF